MASHRMNAASSRSHCIFRVHVERKRGKGGHVTSSSMCFVDLAGSEKATQTGATGVTLNESIGINTSLQVLRRVITALAKDGDNTPRNRHVPYRDSKLTSLLQHAIGGNSITVMVK
jgi:kinesin family protein 1